ncbi:MAG TPA: cyclase family protein [Chloroflexota bacterium]|nr:cyclase family protein [Chloroflexota bacterium]
MSEQESAARHRRYGALPDPLITPALRALMRSGRVFSLQQTLRPDMPQWAAQPAYALTTVVTHDESSPMMRRPVTGSFERIEHSGHSGTHIDALCHVGCWHGDQPLLHGEVPARAIESPRGFDQLGAEHFPPIITRGVLLDVPAARGEECVPDLYEITPDDLRRCEERQGVRIEPGSAVLVRTGFERYWQDPQHYLAQGAGPGLAAARYLAEQGAIVTGADTANYEVLAFPDLPAHMFLIYERGIPIVENLRLSELAATQTYEFLFVALPIAFAGATGSTLHPIAIA